MARKRKQHSGSGFGRQGPRRSDVTVTYPSTGVPEDATTEEFLRANWAASAAFAWSDYLRDGPNVYVYDLAIVEQAALPTLRKHPDGDALIELLRSKFSNLRHGVVPDVPPPLYAVRMTTDNALLVAQKSATE